jgi:hypothetical protein
MQGERMLGVGCAGALCLLLALATGCGSDAPQESLRTVRSMVPSEEPASAVAELDLPDLDTPVEEDFLQASAPTDQAPLIRAMQIDPAPQVPAGNDISVVVDALDPEGEEVELEFRWFVNEDEVDHEGPVFSTASLTAGDGVRVEVVASDGRSESAAMVGPLLTVVGGRPRIVSQPEAPGADGSFRYQVQADEAARKGQLRYSLARAPQGMRISAVRGLVEWSPRPDQTGVHPVEVVAENPAGHQARQSFELSIGAPPAAQAP